MSNALAGIDLAEAPASIKEAEEEKIEKTQENSEAPEKTLAEVLSVFPDAPDDTDIERWKQEHGEALCSGFSDTELFIFRPITREEFVNLQTLIANSQQQISNFEVEQKVVETCTLWASPPALESLSKKAGSLSTLHEQILQASNFVNPAYASQWVIKL